MRVRFFASLFRLFLVCLVLMILASDVFAGPILNRIRERREARQGGCAAGQCSPASPAFSAAPQSGCPGGVCPAPSPGFDASPYPNASGVTLRPVPGAPRSPYTYGPGCPCPVGECPCDRSGARQSDPHQAVTQAGSLVTVSGRVLLSNGDGTYRYADERPTHLPSHILPAGGSCPGGNCPIPQRFVFPVK